MGQVRDRPVVERGLRLLQARRERDWRVRTTRGSNVRGRLRQIAGSRPCRGRFEIAIQRGFHAEKGGKMGHRLSALVPLVLIANFAFALQPSTVAKYPDSVVVQLRSGPKV